ncbi:MAG: hypothetical protein ACI93R_002021 [Flavobacteriales bacterium]|jgi:hypothetical protein
MRIWILLEFISIKIGNWSFLVADQVHYFGTLENVDEAEQYTGSLLRSEENDALESVVTMPLSFDITSPVAGTTFSLMNDEISIEWNAAEDNLTVEASVETNCINGRQDTYSVILSIDDGELILAVGDLDSLELAGSCSSTLTILKTRFGRLDTRYDGGFISASQARSVFLRTTESELQSQNLRIKTLFSSWLVVCRVYGRNITLPYTLNSL